MTQLNDAIARQLSESNVTGPQRPLFKNNVPLWISGNANHDDYMVILNNLPNLFKDAQKTSIAICHLIKMIIDLQSQITALKSTINTVAIGKVTVVAQENMQSLLLKLAEMGCDVGKPKLSLQMLAHLESDSNEKISENTNSESSSKDSLEISGEVKGVLSVLASLSVSGTSESENNVKKLITRAEDRSKHERKSFTGTLNAEFDSISGNPMAKAIASSKKKGKGGG